jgi:putative membrane protein
VIQYDGKSFLSTVFRLHGSVLPVLVPRIVIVGVIGAVSAFAYDEWRVAIPTIAHTLVGVALGLLLVFRTNASYDRYWEGRKLFGALNNRSRDLVRQSLAYVSGDDAEGRHLRSEVQRLVCVFYALLRQLLRGERELSAVAALTPSEKAALEPIAVRPTLVVMWLTERLATAHRRERLSPEALRLMDQNLTAMVDAWGGAERILRTPIPFAYAQHIKAFLALFCASAPFAMVQTMGWYTPLAAAVLAFGLFGIEEIGVEIEDPFGHDPNDLPLDAMNERVVIDTKAMLDARDPAV